MTFPTDPTERKAFALLTFLTAYFPDAIEALVRLSQKGNVQHKIDRDAVNPFALPGDAFSWDRSKSTDETETLMRHLWQHERAKRGVGSFYDDDGHLHIVKVMWRAGAEAQRTIERYPRSSLVAVEAPPCQQALDPRFYHIPAHLRPASAGSPSLSAGVSSDEFDREFNAVDGLNRVR